MPKKDNKKIEKKVKTTRKRKTKSKKLEESEEALSEYDSDSYLISKKVNRFAEGTEGDDYQAEEEPEDQEEDEDVMSDNVEIEDEDEPEDEPEDEDADGDEAEDAGDEPDEKSEDEARGGDDACLYKHAADDDSDDDIGEVYNETQLYESKEIVAKEDRKTKPFITKYEKIRLISGRAKQISLGAKPMIKDAENISAKDVALLELKYKILPLKIERTLPDGKIEHWTIDEFQNL